MEYLQYISTTNILTYLLIPISFKPYYKWNTFNTAANQTQAIVVGLDQSFKPYYKWNTFNTIMYDVIRIAKMQ